MSIDVKCNKCGSTYSVTDKLSGGSVRCAKCRAPIHVPIVRQPPQPQLAASPAEAAAAADLDFDYSPNLSPAAAASTAPAPARPAPAPSPAPSPPAPAAPPPLPSASGSAAPVSNTATAGNASDRPSAAAASQKPSKFDVGKIGSALGAMFTRDLDFRFRSYWTGTLARVVWILAVCAAVGAILFDLHALSQLSAPSGKGLDGIGFLILVQIASIGAGLVVLRIALETISVLFDIAKTLREVRDELRNRP